MIDIKEAEYAIVCKKAIRFKPVRDAVRETDKHLITKLQRGTATIEEMTQVIDVLFDTFCNESPVVEEYTGDGGIGDFPINISGISGLYYVSASEFDDIGLFYSLNAAREAVREHYGEMTDRWEQGKD